MSFLCRLVTVGALLLVFESPGGMLEILWFFRDSLGGAQIQTTHPVEGNVPVQGGSKQVTYKHSGCKIQAIKLSYCKIQD